MEKGKKRVSFSPYLLPFNYPQYYRNFLTSIFYRWLTSAEIPWFCNSCALAFASASLLAAPS